MNTIPPSAPPAPGGSGGPWDWPTILTLVISVIALVVAIGSWEYARRRDQRDAARWHKEQTPTLTGGVSVYPDDRRHRLWLKLRDGDPLTGLSVEITTVHPQVSFEPNQEGVPGGRSIRAESDKQLTVGGLIAWRIEMPERYRPDSLELLVTCRRPRQEWQVPVTAPVVEEDELPPGLTAWG